MDNIKHNIFNFDQISVFFKHTDYHGFVHPYNYLEWMSYTREAFFQELVPNFLELCNRNIKMVTVSVEFELFQDCVFGDRILVRIYAENVKRLSFDVIFQFYNKKTGVLLGVGRQRITFIDAVAEKPARIPEELNRVILEYERK